jgi:hypothetical protein
MGKNEIKIEVVMSGTTKAYAGLITGTDAQYGFALEFLDLTTKSRMLHSATITAPGDYKILPGATVRNEAHNSYRRNDTGYLRVSEDGACAEITKDQAAAMISQ